MSQQTLARYNPPPNWPPAPAGWTPSPDWKPDPTWGPPPPGHQLWVTDEPPKKRFGKGKIALIILGVIVVIAILANLGGGDDPSAAPVADDAATSAPADPSVPVESSAAPVEPAEPAEPGIGTPVRDGKFEFTVTGVERPGTTIGESFMEETAQGEFVIVRINVTNIGDEAQTLSSGGQVLLNDKGQKFEPSSAIFSLPDADKFFLENINPGNTVTGAPLLFDVAPGTVLSSIELHDSLFSGGVTVSLTGS